MVDGAGELGGIVKKEGSGTEIKKVVPLGSNHPAEVYTDGSAQINRGKVGTYARGKAELDIDAKQARINEIEAIKKIIQNCSIRI